MNNHKIFDFNPIPVLIYESEENIFDKEDIDILIKEEFHQHEFNYSSLSVNNNLLEDKKYSKIKKIYENAISFYTKDILNIENKFKMTNSWLSKNKKNQEHYWHTHPNVMLSAVSYFNEQSILTEFAPLLIKGIGLNNIFKNFQFEFDPQNLNQFNSHIWEIKPITNQIIIFPSWMEHKSIINTKEEIRYCLGTNFFLNDFVGRNNEASGLNIKV
jgi:hypothetical protein